MKSKIEFKELFVLICILIVLIFLLVFLVFGNNKETLEEEKKESSNEILISNDSDLKKVDNYASFKEDDYKKNEEIYKEKTRYFLIYIESLINEENKVLLVDEVSDEVLFSLTNSMMAGDGESLCYLQDYFLKKVYDNFGKAINKINSNEASYTLKKDNICFEEVFLNDSLNSKIVQYNEDEQNIIIKALLNDKSYLFTYVKSNKKVFLKKVELL